MADKATTADEITSRRFGSLHEQPCKQGNVLTCALWECQKANECQYGRPREPRPAPPRVHTAPPFQAEKGLQFYARDSDGQWHYVNHAGQWCACPPPDGARGKEAW